MAQTTTLQSLIWLATEGELGLNNLDDKKEDEEHQLLLCKLKFISEQIGDDIESMKNWCFNAKKFRACFLRGPVARLQFKLYRKALKMKIKIRQRLESLLS